MSWKTVKLKNCTQIISGSTPRRNVEEYWGGDIFWATPKDLSNLEGKYLSTTPDKITQKGYQSCSTTLLPPNSVLFSSRAPIGHVAINTVPMATNQGFKSFIPDPEMLDSSYLFYWLKANTNYLQSLGRGATFKEVSKSIVEEIEIPLPPLGEQRRIAAVLDKADALRQKRRAALAKLDTLLQSTFLHMFGDPVTNPMGWEVIELEEVVSLRGGYAFKSKDYEQSGIPLIRIGEVNRIDFDSEDLIYLPGKFKEKLQRFIVQNGTILMSLTGTTGKDDYGNAVILHGKHKEYFLNQRVASIIPDNKILDNIYLYTFLKDQKIKNQLTGKSRGIRQANISNSDIAKLLIPIPPLNKQRVLQSIALTIQSQQEQFQNTIVHFDNLFHALQQRAFNGQL